MISSVLREGTDSHGHKRLAFWCPGCNDVHSLRIRPAPSPSWDWNGNAERPTFQPSVLVTYNDLSGEEKDEVCHSFVTDGRIQFLGDCTHKLAGQTVYLPEWKP